MKPCIAVVDDDISVRESLESLIRSVGLAVKVYASAEEFLDSEHDRKADCLILDIRLPGMSGIELHRCLIARKSHVPVIFVTGHGYDERTRSQALSAWTVACLNKPFSDDELVDAIYAGLKLKPDNCQTN